MEIAENILDTIGRTPLVKINRLNPNPEFTNIYAKVEGFNPTGSIKDRIALNMIEHAESTGQLTPGKIILEASSGNTGIALAMVGIARGYKVEVTMSEGVSIERRKILRSYGVKVHLEQAVALPCGRVAERQRNSRPSVGQQVVRPGDGLFCTFRAAARKGVRN